jgi:hypothetical protein
MNWFQRHLNWTFVLGWVLALVAGIVVESRIDPSFSDDAAGAVGRLVIFGIVLVVSALVIHRKGRSLWWLLLAGWFSPLWLANKKT